MSSLKDRREDRRRAERRSWWLFLPRWLSGAFWMLGLIGSMRWVAGAETGWPTIICCAIGVVTFLWAERLLIQIK